MVAEHFDIDASEFEVESNNIGDHSSYKSTVYMNSCIYTWRRENADEIEAEIAEKTKEMMMNAGKTGKVDIGEAMNMKSPNYTVGISAMKVYDKGEDYHKLFSQSHQNMSDEEKEEHTENISEGTGETGEAVTGSMMKELNFTEVEGVGDAAAWDHLGGALNVLIGNFQFSVQVDYSYEDNNKNIEKAKALAMDVLENL